MQTFDISKIKPGWSMSKVGAFDCPRRGGLLQCERLPEPKGDAAMVGGILAEVLGSWRVHWLQEGVNIATAHVEPEIVAKRAAQEEGGTAEHVEEALRLFYDAAGHMRADLLPDRDKVAAWWVEEKVAFDRQWNRIRFREGDEKWWGSAEQREKTWWRMKSDLTYLDTDGVLHVHDDKSGGEPNSKTQLHAYAFCGVRLPKQAPEQIQVRYNLIGQKRVTRADVLTVDDVAGFPGWVEKQVERITSLTDWSPRRGPQCSWCGFKFADPEGRWDTCPHYAQVGQQLASADTLKAQLPSEIATLEQFHSAAMLYDVAQDYLTAVRKLLEAFLREKAEDGVVSIPGLGKCAKLVGDSVWSAPLGAAVKALAEAGVPREVILENGTISKGKVEDIVKKAWPTGGKGITKEIRAEHYGKRAEALEQVLNVGTESPRRASLRIVQEEAAQ